LNWLHKMKAAMMMRASTVQVYYSIKKLGNGVTGANIRV
jgi:hypothetical protein